MLALKTIRVVRPKPVWSRTTTIVINIAKKLIAKDGTCVSGIKGEVIGLS